VRRCPYLEEFYKDTMGPLKVFHFDCHVDATSKRKYSFRNSAPICVRDYENCRLYQQEKRREDGLISRYTD
jgi:hypothetical protein